MAPRSGPATRARLVRAALDCFTTLGYHQTTTPLLADRAGVAEGTIYRHFPDKRRLHDAVVRLGHERLLAALADEDADRERLRCPERLARLARRLAADCEAEPAMLRLALEPPADPPPDDATRDLARQFREGLVQLIASGKSDGLVRAGPAELWAGVWFAVLQHALGRITAREWGAEHPSVALVTESAWAAIAGA